jgi:hypothetical protein
MDHIETRIRERAYALWELTAGLREAPAGGRRAGDTVRAGAGRNGVTRAPWTRDQNPRARLRPVGARRPP